MERHKILGGKVALYRRSEDGAWHCYTFLQGKEWRQSTKEKSLTLAKEVATDWYLELCAKDRHGELYSGKSFAKVAAMFTDEYEAVTRGHRSPKWVRGHKDRIRLHLMPFFGKMPVEAITSGTVQEYRMHRMTGPQPEEGQEDTQQNKRPWKCPAR